MVNHIYSILINVPFFGFIVLFGDIRKKVKIKIWEISKMHVMCQQLLSPMQARNFVYVITIVCLPWEQFCLRFFFAFTTWIPNKKKKYIFHKLQPAFFSTNVSWLNRQKKYEEIYHSVLHEIIKFGVVTLSTWL